jgi:penicillin amidase
MEVWQERVARAYFSDQVVDLVRAGSGVAARLIERGDDDLHWFSMHLGDEIAAAARDSVQLLRTRYGDDPSGWHWGNVHQAYWRHPLIADGYASFDVGPAAVDGGPDCLRNTGAGEPAFLASSGAEYRLVVDFAEPHRFLAVQNIGNSGQPGSPHYSDQFDAWRSGKYHVVSLRRVDVEKEVEGTTVLQPS